MEPVGMVMYVPTSGLLLYCRLLVLRASVQKYVDEYADTPDPWVLAVEDWNMMVAMRDLLSPAIYTCKDLEADLSVRVLRVPDFLGTGTVRVRVPYPPVPVRSGTGPVLMRGTGTIPRGTVPYLGYG